MREAKQGDRSGKHGMFVQDLKEEIAQNVEEIYSLMLLGVKNRAIAETDMNEHSSRSHTIFQVNRPTYLES